MFLVCVKLVYFILNKFTYLFSCFWSQTVFLAKSVCYVFRVLSVQSMQDVYSATSKVQVEGYELTFLRSKVLVVRRCWTVLVVIFLRLFKQSCWKVYVAFFHFFIVLVGFASTFCAFVAHHFLLKQFLFLRKLINFYFFFQLKNRFWWAWYLLLWRFGFSLLWHWSGIYKVVFEEVYFNRWIWLHFYFYLKANEVL